MNTVEDSVTYREEMVKIIRLEAREEDMKKLFLAFQERKPEWAEFMETRVECPVCGCHTIPYAEEDVWICQGCKSVFRRLQEILKVADQSKDHVQRNNIALTAKVNYE